jgi:cyclase
MLKTRVMPCLLLSDSRLVKTIRFANPNYIGDPVNVVKIYNEKEVDELIFLDISATVNKNPPSFRTISEISNECFMPLTFGGGIRNIGDMKKIFYSGVEKISINSYAVDDPSFIKQASEQFGSQSIVISIDAKLERPGKYRVYTHGGRVKTRFSPSEFASLMELYGAGEILLTSIDKEGTMSGYDTTLIHQVSESVNIPVIACGGAGKIEDFGEAVKAGASAVAAGSMVVYQGIKRGVLINFPKRDELEGVIP